MAELTPQDLGERQRLEQAAQANLNDYAAQLKLAQFEAKILLQTPADGEMSRVLQPLDYSLANLPAEHHPRVAQMVQQLHQNGVKVGEGIQQGNYPRLLALLKKQPVPQGSLSAPASQPSAAAPAVSSAPKTAIKEVEMGEVSTTQLKAWMTEGNLEMLANAYSHVDNFRTRRVVIDKVGEKSSPLAAACLVRMLAQTHDENLNGDIIKKLLGFDHDMLGRELVYDPNDPKSKVAVVTVLAALKSEPTVEPLTLALSDPDYHVRVKAIEGLAEILEPSQEWIDHLANIVKTEPESSVRVRVAAATALQKIGTREAFMALDQASKESKFDNELQTISEELGSKYRSGGVSDKRKTKMQEDAKKKEKDRKKVVGEESKFNPKLIGMIAVVVAAFVGLTFFAYLQFNKMTHPQLGFVPPKEAKPMPKEVKEQKSVDADALMNFMKDAGKPKK